MLPILHQDDHLVAIDKPAGLLVHRSPIDRRETRFAVQLLRDQIGRQVYPVHRLDKGTSGVLLFALDPLTARRLAACFEQGEVRKTYLAVVRGWTPDAGLIDHPLRRDPDEAAGTSQRIQTQEARTEYRRVATIELPWALDRHPTSRYALVTARPLTGRRHQIRRHFKHIAHPIIGDATHGKGLHNRYFQREFDCHRLLLAATALELAHPASGAPLSLRAPPGDDFAALLRRFGWPIPAPD